ncbi:MAG: chromate efflux transporter [Pseudomonadota bacterium]
MTTANAEQARQSALQVFAAFFRLGLTSFGGPIAHIGYFRDDFVTRRRWLNDASYADLVALCQFLPGPASSQVGIGIGLAKAGFGGALAAWVGFTLPSAIAMALFGYGVLELDQSVSTGALQGLKIAVVAVVAQALWGMGRSLCPDAPRMTIAVLAAAFVLTLPSAWTQVAVIVAGAGIGAWLLSNVDDVTDSNLDVPVSGPLAVSALSLLALMLIGLPVLTAAFPSQSMALFDAFFRSGSLVFGGGHVVLPLLQSEVVPTGWVDNETFLAGYGAAQAIPGPLFTFAAYLGSVSDPAPNGWAGALLCVVAIFLPSFLLVIGVLPFWSRLRRARGLRRALVGINAAVVGLLLAAFYDPVWTSAIRAPADFVVALGAFLLLVSWRTPPWLVVALAGLAGWGLSMTPAG